MIKKIFVLLVIFPTIVFAQDHSDKVVKKKRPSAFNNGKFLNEDGKKLLYGGSSESQHFDITDISLKEEQFHYGLGREAFPALLRPEFISVEKADKIWDDDARFLVAYSGNEVKAYSVKDLTRHEIVNDVLNDEPIMAAYCILADLGAIYKRDYGGEVLTFGVSGYTYFDPEIWDGLDAFILWDRETESLWWPLVEKAVSGPLKEVKLMEMDKSNWKDIKWKYIKETYPNAQVLKSNQDFERPNGWEREVDVSEIKKNYTSKE